MDDDRPPLQPDPSLQNIEDAIVILALDRVITLGSLEDDPEMEKLAVDSITRRLMRLLGVKEG